MKPEDRAGPPRVTDYNRCKDGRFEPCRFEPGGKECGCPVAAKDNMLPACDGSFESCVGYGNQANFGGTLKMDFWPEPSAEDFPIPTVQQVARGLNELGRASSHAGFSVVAKASEPIESGDFVIINCKATPPAGCRADSTGDFSGRHHEQDPTEDILNGWNEELVAPVTAYEVGGKVYQNRPEAVQATTERAFLEWYENGADNTLYGRYEGSRIDGDVMLQWIKDHRHALAKLLKTMV